MNLTEVLMSIGVFTLLMTGGSRLTWGILKGTQKNLSYVRETREILKNDVLIRKSIKTFGKESKKGSESFALQKSQELMADEGLGIRRTENLYGRDGKIKGLRAYWKIGESEYVTEELF